MGHYKRIISLKTGDGEGRGRRLGAFFALGDLGRRTAGAVFAASMALFVISGLVRGDEIELTSGMKVTGKIIEESPDFVRIRLSKGSVMQLPRSKIKTLKREQLSISEEAGDLARSRQNYYDAKNYYERAMKEAVHSEELEEKLKEVKKLIEEHETQLYMRLFKEARTASAAGDSEEAILKFQNIIDQAPSDGPFVPKAKRALAYEYFMKSFDLRDRIEYDKAIQTMQKAVRLEPKTAVFHLELAELVRKYGKDDPYVLTEYAIGTTLAKTWLEKDAEERKKEQADIPREAQLNEAKYHGFLYDKAELKFQTGRKLEAAQEFLGLVEKDTFSEFETEKIVGFIIATYTDPSISRQLDNNLVLEKLDKVLELKKQTPKALMLKGQIYLEEDRGKDAVDALTQAIEMDPRIPGLHRLRARAHLLGKNTNQARRDLQKELTILSSYDVICELGQIMLLESDYDNALAEFNRATRMDADRHEGLVGKAKSFRIKATIERSTHAMKEELLNSAERDIDLVLRTSGNLPEAVLEKGQIILQKGHLSASRQRGSEARLQYVAAAEYFGSVIEKLKERQDKLNRNERRLLAESYVERGGVNLTQLNDNQALIDFEEALNVLPEYALAYNRLGDVFKRKNEYDLARQHYQKAIELNPQKADYELSLALLYHTQIKDYNKAIEHYKHFQSKGGLELQLAAWIRECENAMRKKP